MIVRMPKLDERAAKEAALRTEANRGTQLS